MVLNPMNTPPDRTPSSQPEPIQPPQTARTKRRFLPAGCFQWGFAGFVVFVLLALLLPTCNTTAGRGIQTKALAQAKQIGLSLKLYAGDNDGVYPRQGNPVVMTEAPRNSNIALACLFPTYTTSERIFGNKLSAYQSARGPDDVIDNPYTGHPVQTLRPGENVYGYVMGLTDEANPESPLIADGTDGTRHYNKNEHARGGTWKGGRAIVIRLDNSGTIETLVGPDDALYVPRRADRSRNLLDVSGLGKDVCYLDPAIPPP